MASIAKIKPEQILYTVTRQLMGNTKIKYDAVHSIAVVEVDPDHRFVMASWNGNSVRKFSADAAKKWKVEKPVVSKPALFR